MNKQKSYCGFVAIVGRSNVGKSTLVNKLIGQKVSITSRKPQTTRHRIIGIVTENNYQIIYIDTPGFHVKEKRPINRLMNRTASKSISNVQMIIFVIECKHWTIEDEMIINKLRRLSCPILLLVNKIDDMMDKTRLLPYIHFLSKKMNFLDIIPISAKKDISITFINKIVQKNMLEAVHNFPKEYITDRSQYFMASEIIREKLMRFLGDELPYSSTVKIEQFLVNEYGIYNIYAVILVERDTQKKMVIGNKGSKIKKIGIEARMDMKNFFSTKVHLKLWVKVQPGWTNDEYVLRNLGYIDHLH
ncbi:MAG: GTPase Era [Arsenophonus sp.]